MGCAKSLDLNRHAACYILFSRSKKGQDFKMKRNKMNRRVCLRRAAGSVGALLAVPHVVPSNVLGKDGAVASSEKITVGFIGTGGHGIHRNLRMYLGQPAHLGKANQPTWRKDSCGVRATR